VAARVRDAAPVPRQQKRRVVGNVSLWRTDERWGALRSPDVDGEVWVHFSDIEADGYRSLTEGEPVTFTYETSGQDGSPHRALLVRAGNHA